jgi:hypothetical protein
MPNGGKLEAFLDGNPLGAFDAYSGEESTKSSDAIVHRFGLTNKSHTLRIVALGEPFPGSAGALVTLQDLIVYR